jgi:hypothetical protein
MENAAGSDVARPSESVKSDCANEADDGQVI